MLGAILMILAVEISLPTHRFFTKPLFAFLGELSFPLYLVHVLILCSAGSFVFVVAPPILAGPLATLATVAGSFLAAYPLVVFNRHWVSWLNRTVRLIYPIEVCAEVGDGVRG
jgi:peptidoglycan/LPS O-acetylase OafA/YrhL